MIQERACRNCEASFKAKDPRDAYCQPACKAAYEAWSKRAARARAAGRPEPPREVVIGRAQRESKAAKARSPAVALPSVRTARRKTALKVALERGHNNVQELLDAHTIPRNLYEWKVRFGHQRDKGTLKDGRTASEAFEEAGLLECLLVKKQDEEE